MGLRPLDWAGRTLVRAGNQLLKRSRSRTIWVDVGAHLGEKTYPFARSFPSLLVFAFEPNWVLARQLMARLSNFVVLPMAISDQDGMCEFFFNSDDQTSSLLPFAERGLHNWKGGERLRLDRKARVPSIRLDTFMHHMEIETVEYLKIDAQGSDLAVVRSAGARLQDINKITLEVDVTATRLYEGSASREQTMRYMTEHGFSLAASESQSFGQEENLTFKRNGSG